MQREVTIKLESDCYKSAAMFISDNSMHWNVYDYLIATPKFNKEISRIYVKKQSNIMGEVIFADKEDKLIAFYQGILDAVKHSICDPRAVRVLKYTIC